MAFRPIFVPGGKSGALFRELSIQFQWHPGMAPSQKKKNVAELHAAAAKGGVRTILEVSTKSEVEIGRRLSAFTLDVELSGIVSKVECIYQASKVFERGGPFLELTNYAPIDAKRFFKGKNLGMIKHFELLDKRYENLPHHAFYDWLFVKALNPHAEFLSARLEEYEAFSDIEFNPEKSINTQARSIAIIKCLILRNLMTKCAEDFDYFRSMMFDIEKRTSTQIQLGLAGQ